LLLICIALPALLAIATAVGFAKILPSAELRHAFFTSEAVSSLASVALLGHVFAPTIGGLTAWRFGVGGGLLVGLGSMLFVVRYTPAQRSRLGNSNCWTRPWWVGRQRCRRA